MIALTRWNCVAPDQHAAHGSWKLHHAIAIRKRDWTAQAIHSQQVLVVGGGAAGLTAAYFAASAGAQVTVLERTREPGRKILISGGQRCNVLPMDCEVERDFFSESSRSALRAAFASWTVEECRDWLEHDVGLPLNIEPATRKYFPASNSARDVRDALVAACRRRGVAFQHDAHIVRLQPGSSSGSWRPVLAGGGGAAAGDGRVVVATGGMSFPKLGTDGSGHRMLQQLGVHLHACYPALTPLIGPHPAVAALQATATASGLPALRIAPAALDLLAGVSLDASRLAVQQAARPKRKAGKRPAAVAERSAMLFTHRGFSGPAVLDLSHHLTMAMERGTQPPELHANWLGWAATQWEQALAASSGAPVQRVVARAGLPQRLADALCNQAGCDGGVWAQLTKVQRSSLLQTLTAFQVQCTGHEGYAKAEVTGGGVPLGDVDMATMQLRKLPGVYLCGEIMDVFGRIGGYNFWWAWLSGRLAGLAAGKAAVADALPPNQ